ncbi:hypothetical protein D9M70_594540 [compost metagenome]
MVERKAARGHGCRDPPVPLAGGRADQLPPLPVLGSILDVGDSERRDALAGDVGRLERPAQEFIRQNDHLEPYVVAFNIRSRIGFCIT